MSAFLQAVKAAHEAHEKTAQHQQALAWGQIARQRLDAAARRRARR
jgi:hypothetical protein